MEILLTGNTVFLTQHWVQCAFPQDHVLMTTERETSPDPHIRTVTLRDKQLLEQLVETYEFDRIVYFSEYLIPHREQEGELDRLRRVLQANRSRPIQLLYLAGPESVLTPPTGKAVLARSAEMLCRHYAQSSEIQIKILHLPYLYGTESPLGSAGFAPLFTQAQQGTVCMDEQAQQPVYALCMEDLAELVARIFDSWTPELEEFTAPVVFAVQHQQLGEKLQALCPGAQVQYGTDTLQQYPPDDGVLRRRYGWFPRYSLLDDLPGLWARWQSTHKPPEAHPVRRFWNQLRTRRQLRSAVEILAAWLAAEFLVQLTGTQAQFRMVDIRLLFVVLVGTIYGLNAGVQAACLAAVSLVLGYARQGTAPVLLFYEPTNWLAFLVYFVAGAVCGYVQLRSTEEVQFVQDACSLLRQRLCFVTQLYRDTLEDKRALRRQLLARRDSFGKLYAVTRQLDGLPPSQLYAQAVQILEDMLENHTLAIYRLDASQRTAQRAAVSRAFAAKAPQTLELAACQPVLQAIAQEGLWVNRGLLPELPMYAAAVQQNDAPIALLFLYEADEAQCTLYHQNLFRILCGLVETALLHALTAEKTEEPS